MLINIIIYQFYIKKIDFFIYWGINFIKKIAFIAQLD